MCVKYLNELIFENLYFRTNDLLEINAWNLASAFFLWFSLIWYMYGLYCLSFKIWLDLPNSCCGIPQAQKPSSNLARSSSWLVTAAEESSSEMVFDSVSEFSPLSPSVSASAAVFCMKSFWIKIIDPLAYFLTCWLLAELTDTVSVSLAALHEFFIGFWCRLCRVAMAKSSRENSCCAGGECRSSHTDSPSSSSLNQATASWSAKHIK